jgi:hypothetical protein
MQQLPPNPPKKAEGRSAFRTPPDANASLFSTRERPALSGPQASVRRTERGRRIAGDVKRGVLFAAVLVVVGLVLYQFLALTNR